jgi:ABC-type lipoprotein export system ATPase subunit
MIELKTKIHHDQFTEVVNKMFDVTKEEYSIVQIENNISPPEDWNIGLIFGESGSGKTTLLKTFGEPTQITWTDKAIISDLGAATPEEASEVLSAVGLSTIPSWMRPYSCLSNGEKFRADLAKAIINSDDLVLIDEFTSVVDRNVAKAASNAIQKYVRRKNKRVILSSCHSDIIPWLQPDWLYNPNEAQTHVLPRGSLRRPEIELKIFRAKYDAWNLFSRHHYLDNNLNRSARLYMATWNDNPVAIVAILALPHAKLKKAWRGSRLVVLPDYQGLNIGTKLSDYFGSLVVAQGGRYFSRTIHPAMIAYRLKGTDWRIAFKGKVSPGGKTSKKHGTNWKVDTRECYSFEYIGPPASKEESDFFWIKDETTLQVLPEI